MPRVRRSKEDQRLVDDYGPDFLEVLARGLKVLNAFNAANRTLSLSDLAKEVDQSRATVRRTLYTLEKLGYVESDGRAFRLTPKVLNLAVAFLSSGLPAVLQPTVDRVSTTLHEACAAAVLDHDEIVFIARASPVRVISVDLAIGYRLPAYCTSLGRVLLGALDEAALDAYLARVTPATLTQHTITDKTVLKATIITDRAQGFSIVDREAEVGLRSIAVPVRRHDGKMVCALHVGVHVESASLGRLYDEFLPVLRRAADELARVVV